jgi:MerR HTH family regulatory protein
MHEYLDGLSLSDVSALSGAKADTIKHWLHRGQLDQPPIYGKDRVFMAEHVLQVCLMKLLTASGIAAKKPAQKPAGRPWTRSSSWGPSWSLTSTPFSVMRRNRNPRMLRENGNRRAV